jgi:Ankyrin repeats (3 copies)
MYPNPQEALPLPPRPRLEQYKKRAKDLVKACKSGTPEAIRTWTTQWIETLAEIRPESDRRRQREEIDRLAEFAHRKLAPNGGGSRRCGLADAQFIMARAHGFLSWPKFAAHLDSLARAASTVSAFEAAADAIVTGDAPMLRRLLREHPDLVRARSTREHNATLLHYVSANGVEGYRQRSPKNAAAMAEILLQARAEVDPEADVYGGGCTPLGLVATSTPPLLAGVQRDVIDVLLRYGARMDHPGSTGNRSALVHGCLANGCPEAAEYLVQRGAPLDFPGAAGVGRLDAVKRFVGDAGTLSVEVTKAQLEDGFGLACVYGRAEVVDFLLDRGIEVDRELRVHGDGHTALHVASFHGHLDIVRSLVRGGADANARDKTWKTPPLYWAYAGWCEKSDRADERYFDVVALLVAAGAVVNPEMLDWEQVRADPRMRAALTPGSQR